MIRRFSLSLVLICIAAPLCAQLLDREISIDLRNRPLAEVLEIIGKKGDFYFSYNSRILPQDSLVSIRAEKQPLRQLLPRILGPSFQFSETGNYIIVKRQAAVLNRVKEESRSEEKYFVVSGQILNAESGEGIPNATVYERELLAATLTDQDGRFILRLKGRNSRLSLAVSRSGYSDTSLSIRARYNQQLVIAMQAEISEPPAPASAYRSTPDSLRLPLIPSAPALQAVGQTFFGRHLVSMKQKWQTVNLQRFFATRNFQVSLTPGLGTHGSLSGQVSNIFSLNVLGGYNGGVRGAEIGGAFNINTRATRFLQVAGVFNLNGQLTQGVQVAGVFNTVLDSFRGVQVAGVTNLVRGAARGVNVTGVTSFIRGNMQGLQLSGASNHARKVAGWQIAGAVNVAAAVEGVQVAGAINVAAAVKGVQIAGAVNIARKEMRGFQLGVTNYAKTLRGVQFGLINISDSSSGYSFGLVNIVRNGYRTIAFTYDEMGVTQIAFKSGTRKFYGIVSAGMRIEDDKLYTLGYGFGREWKLIHWLRLHPELTANYFYAGEWRTNLVTKLQLLVTVRLSKYLSLAGGPSFSMLYSDQTRTWDGYRFPIAPSTTKTLDLGGRLTGWVGYTIGLHLL